MTEEVCYTVSECRTEPASTTFEPDNTWDATAISQADADLANFRYTFTPVQGAVFYTGVFDSANDPVPRPGLYKVAVLFEVDRLKLVIDGVTVGNWFPVADGDVVALQREGSLVRILINGVEQTRYTYG